MGKVTMIYKENKNRKREVENWERGTEKGERKLMVESCGKCGLELTNPFMT